MTDRYKKMFQRVAAKGEGAFIPFAVLGDPNPKQSLEFIRALIEAGADALELGLPFSDPIADGPIIQVASQRALAAGTKISDCFKIIAKIRADHPDIPIGLLVYANLVEGRGANNFYKAAKTAGVDSVLVADIPACEIDPYRNLARKAGVKTVLILPMDAPENTIREVAKKSEGYLYLLSRSGVTGTETEAGFPSEDLMKKLEGYGSAPPVLGFGISQPGHVAKALESGCAGAISGSAVVRIMEKMIAGEANPQDLEAFIRSMKAATKVV